MLTRKDGWQGGTQVDARAASSSAIRLEAGAGGLPRCAVDLSVKGCPTEVKHRSDEVERFELDGKKEPVGDVSSELRDEG